MPDPLRCSRCGSDAIIPRVRVLDQDEGGTHRDLQADASPTVSALEELDRTREALADSQLRLQELEEKLAFVEQLIEPRRSDAALPKKSS